MSFPRWLKAAVAIVGLFVVAYPVVVEFLVDWLWFDTLGYDRAFLLSSGTRAALFLVGFLLAGSFLFVNIRLAFRNAPIEYARLAMQGGELNMTPNQVRQFVALGQWAITLLPAFLFALIASSHWLDALSYLHRVPFDRVDPIYGLDIGFYFFTLPVLVSLRAFLAGILFLTMIPVAGVYVGRELLLQHTRPSIPRAARAHLAGLGAGLFGLVAIGYWLDRFQLLFRQRGAVYGMGYADVEAQLPALWIMVGLAAVVGVILLVSAFRSGLRLPLMAVGGYFIGVILINDALPGVVQDYVVKPNELEVERPYLEHNIQATREAYALDRIEVKPFDAQSGLTLDSITNNPLTLNNIRLWDSRPLKSTYSQLQEIRLYYDFVDVDVDRYTIDGELRQVMLSARELNYDNVPAQARSWVNEHFLYTHGYGLTMSPVNVVTPEGLPELWVKDLPPASTVGIDITRPEIYYGELTDRYVFVKTNAEEFDYPEGDRNVYATYGGTGGVSIGSFARKALFAMSFGSFDVLLSDYLQPESRVMLHRRAPERARHITPFLSMDSDPYLVTVDGKLYWIIDAYTLSDRYPYSEPYSKHDLWGRFNYVRNSVKVVVDAYNGAVDYYVADDQDPVVQVYSRIFPGVFQPMDAMPEELKAHLRYPVDFFNAQSDMYRAYHMTESTVFYNKEDMWDLPQEMYGGQPQQMQSYYLIMNLPESHDAEFILLLPFTPTNRDNMISWLAARSDPPEYGKLVLYQFPKQKLIYGPRQIESRIDQNPDISELITLWSQAGSRVVRGNLLVIPIDDSLMYVEPLYLQAESSQLPELKRVIVSYENTLAMRSTLDEALRAVFAPDSSASDQDAQPPDASRRQVRAGQAQQRWQDLATRATDAFNAAEAAQRVGDWAAYGEHLDELSKALQRLRAVANPQEQVAPEETPDDAALPTPVAP